MSYSFRDNENQRNRDQIESLTKEKYELTEENRRLYARSEEERKVSSDDAKTNYNALTETVQKLEKSRDEISSLREMNEVLNRAKSEHEIKIVELKESLQNYQAELEKVNGEVQWLIHTEEENTKQSQLLAGSLITIENRIQSMTRRIGSSEPDGVNTYVETDTLEDIVCKVGRSLDAFEKELHLSRAESKRDSEMQKESNSRLQSEYRAIQESLQQANINLNSMTEFLNQLESQVESLTKQRDKLEKDKDKLIEQKDALAQKQLDLADKIVDNDMQRRQESKICIIQ